MPTYDYICKDCQHTFEVFRRMTDNSPVSCPKCKKEATRKMSGGIATIYKGTGFYTTDYANKP